MKTSKITIIAACASLFAIVGASAQNAPSGTATPAAAASESNALQIVFVPKKLMDENQKSGKLKENTFYWTNVTDDASSAPTAQKEGDVTFLRLVGKYPEKIEDETTKKNQARVQSVVNLYRAFNLPEGKTKAIVSYKVRATHDIWNDPAQGAGPALGAAGNLVREGKALFVGVTKPQINKGWETLTSNIVIHPGAQQLVINFKTDGGVPLDIASLSVSFE